VGRFAYLAARPKLREVSKLKLVHFSEVPAAPVAEEGAEGVSVRWVIGEDDGAPNFAMRVFEVKPGGHTPRHSHPWEHEVFVLAGEGVLFCAGREHQFREGDVIFVPQNEEHQFLNRSADTLRFICVVPRESYARK